MPFFLGPIILPIITTHRRPLRGDSPAMLELPEKLILFSIILMSLSVIGLGISVMRGNENWVGNSIKLFFLAAIGFMSLIIYQLFRALLS